MRLLWGDTRLLGGMGTSWGIPQRSDNPAQMSTQKSINALMLGR